MSDGRSRDGPPLSRQLQMLCALPYADTISGARSLATRASACATPSSARVERRLVDKAQTIAERIHDIERPLAPRAYDDRAGALAVHVFVR